MSFGVVNFQTTLKKETILNLASNEYDKLIKQHNSDNRNNWC